MVSFIKPCKIDDKACYITSGQAAVPYLAAGIPELGVPAADPMKIETVRSDDSNLKLGFKNVEITGVGKAKIISIVRDAEKKTITIDLETPIRAVGQYDLSGKLLILDAVGNGDFVIETKKAIVHAVLKYKVTEKGDDKYWIITGYDYSYDLPEKVHINLDNLFNGNQQLAKPIQELLDTEWKVIITEIGDPLIKEIIGYFVNTVKQFMKKVPASQLEIV